MNTWREVHVGDVLRGADQRTWTVIERHALPTWALAGEQGRFRLRLEDSGQEVSVDRPLTEAAQIVIRADHTESARALDALLGAELAVEMIEERMIGVFSDPGSGSGDGIKRDRYGRYLLPDPITSEERTWTRATTIAKTLADEYHLTRWKMRKVAKGIAVRPDLIAGAAAADEEEDKDTLNSIAEQAMDAAEARSGANFGTALHGFTHRLDRGEPLESLRAPDPLNADLSAYQAFLRKQRLTCEAVECTVVLPEFGIAGTFDRIVGQPTGVAKASPYSVLDLKTAKSLDFGWLEHVIQLAIYANATHIWDRKTGTYRPMPVDVDKSRALLLHLPVGKAMPTLYGLDIIKGWRYVKLALAVRDARNEAKRKGFAWLVNPDPYASALHEVSRASSTYELAQIWERLHPQGAWTEEIDQAAKHRAAFLQESGE